jgi:hypothetical protein
MYKLVLFSKNRRRMIQISIILLKQLTTNSQDLTVYFYNISMIQIDQRGSHVERPSVLYDCLFVSCLNSLLAIDILIYIYFRDPQLPAGASKARCKPACGRDGSR